MKIPIIGKFFRSRKEKPVQESISELGKIAKLERENKELREQLKQANKKDFVGLDAGDPDKKDRENREAYVSKVAGIHDDILIPKFKSVSARIRDMMSNPTSYGLEDDEKTIRMLQGADWTVWEIIRWGKKLKSEYMSYQQDN